MRMRERKRWSEDAKRAPGAGLWTEHENMRNCSDSCQRPAPSAQPPNFMIALLQRVSQSQVAVDGQTIGAIGRGLMVLVGVERGDTEAQADRLLEKLLTYRVFPDANDRMNLSVQEVAGGLLLVPQFTLAADTSKGTRPGFSSAAPPEEGRRLFHYLADRARERYAPVATGEFGANMQVSLINDGPVTFRLQVPPGPTN
jgi:D-aminoacyl-tRNA deacylase